MADKKKRLYHIFPAGSGNIVLYITVIAQALEQNFQQVTFVSAASPVKNKNLKGWFHPLSDFFRPVKKLFIIIRYTVRYVEFLSAIFAIYMYCLFKRPQYVNLSTASLLKAEYFFIKALKRLKIKTIFTIHDAQPFTVGYKRMTEDKQKLFYNSFDYIIVHNENSKKYIKKNYDIAEQVFIEFPFPPMDLKELKTPIAADTNSGKPTFLFIGTFKIEKGFNILLQAWQQLLSQQRINDAALIFAGNIPEGINTPLHNSDTLPASVKVINKYLSDEEYIQYINQADVVVLPYLVGTNSAVLSTVVSMGKAIIASDIPSLKTNPLILEEDIFIASDVQSLADKILAYINMPAEMLSQKKETKLLQFKELMANYQQETIKAFEALI